LTSLNDTRVLYHEPAKWVAKLRALAPRADVLLKTEMSAGHGRLGWVRSAAGADVIAPTPVTTIRPNGQRTRHPAGARITRYGTTHPAWCTGMSCRGPDTEHTHVGAADRVANILAVLMHTEGKPPVVTSPISLRRSGGCVDRMATPTTMSAMTPKTSPNSTASWAPARRATDGSDLRYSMRSCAPSSGGVNTPQNALLGMFVTFGTLR
jgi:hypothetical protein